MTKDIGFGLGCVAIFGIAIMYVAYNERHLTEVDRAKIARLQREVQRLQQGIAAATRSHGGFEQRYEVATRGPVDGDGQHARRDTYPPVTDAMPSELAAALDVIGSSAEPGSRLRAARALLRAPRSEAALTAARILLDDDVDEGLAAIDGIVLAAQADQSTEPIATRALSLLARNEDGRVHQALQRYAQSAAPSVRPYAAKLLARRGDRGPLEREVAKLTSELNGPDHQQRIRALSWLGYLAEPSSRSQIVALLQDSNSDIRAHALAALSRFNDRSLVASIEPLLGDPVDRVRSAATLALQGIR